MDSMKNIDLHINKEHGKANRSNRFPLGTQEKLKNYFCKIADPVG